MKVRYISHPAMKGRFNMAVDEAIQNACRRGEVIPTVRFYQWNPPCLSLGYFQDVKKEVNLDGLKEMKYDLVRRPTGGKAVLHDDELTYSVIIPEEQLKGSVLETYQTISQALLHGLRSLGIQAELAHLEKGVTGRDPRFHQAACFSAPSWYELVFRGKKIIGSAQSRREGIILQHGSIPFSLNLDHLVKCFTSSPEKAMKMKALLSSKASSINEAMGRPVARDELEKHLVLGFEEALGWELVPSSLTEGEILEARMLSESKYGNPAWTMERGKTEEELY